jgi:hypothetical protein
MLVLTVIAYVDPTFPNLKEEFLNIHIADIPKADQRLRKFHTRPSLSTEAPPILLEAIWNRQITPEHRSAMVQKCLRACATAWPGYIDVKRRGATPLMLATLMKDYDSAKLLVDAGCFVDSWATEPRGMRKWSDGGAMEIVKGLDVRLFNHKKGRAYMYRPLSVAIVTRQTDLALLLAQSTHDGGWTSSYEKVHPISDMLLASLAGMASVVSVLLELGYPVEQSRQVRNDTSLLPDAQPLHAAAGGVDNNIRVCK